jgi:hypothetical protein
MKESAAHDFSPEQAFRELLANAYDEHSLAKLQPRDVQVSEPSEHTICIWNHGSKIVDGNFSLQKSKKLDFEVDVERGFVSCIGCFGEGMAKAAASLASQQCVLVYQTNAQVIVVASTAGDPSDHESRCDAAVATVVAEFSRGHGSSVLRTHQVKSAESTDTTDAVAAVNDAADAAMSDSDITAVTAEPLPVGPAGERQLTTRVYELQCAKSFDGTKLFIILPSATQDTNTVNLHKAWQCAQRSFIYHYRDGPLIDIYTPHLPVLQIFRKLAVPSSLFASDDDDDSPRGDFVFVNGMAYRVLTKLPLYFSFHLIVQPSAHEKELAAVSRLRRILSSKRQLIPPDALTGLLDAALPGPKKNPHAGSLKLTLTTIAFANALAEVAAAMAVDAAPTDTTPLGTLAGKLDALPPSRRIVPRAALISCFRPFEMPSFSMYADLTMQTVADLTNVLLQIDQDTTQRKTVLMEQKSKAKVERLLSEAAETAEAQQPAEEDEDTAMDDSKSATPIPQPSATTVRAVKEVQRVADLPSVKEHAGNAVMLDRIVHILPKLSESKQAEVLISVQQAGEVTVRVAAERKKVPAKVKINVVGTGAKAQDEVVAKARAKAPALDWLLTKGSDPFSHQYFNETFVPVDVLETLLSHGTGTAFDQSFLSDMNDASLNPINRAGRRALLFVLCRILRKVGRPMVDVHLVPSSSISHPSMTGPGVLAGADFYPQAWKHVLSVPYLPCTPSSAENATIDVILPNATILGCLNEVTRVGLQPSAPIIEAHYQALQTMLLVALESELQAISPNIARGSKGTKDAFVINRSSPPPAVLRYHILVLITAWGRKFGGVPTFNMALCQALASMCSWGDGENRREVWVTCVTVTGKDEYTAATPRLRVIQAPSNTGISEEAARLFHVSPATLRAGDTTDWPTQVDLVIGHDRFTGQVAAPVAARFQALSVVFAHTNPLAISGTKDTAKYDAAAKDNLLKASLKSVDQAFGCGNTEPRFFGLVPKHAEHGMLGFHAGYISPSNAKLAPQLQWQGESDESLKNSTAPLHLVIVGRLTEKLKNVVQVHKLVQHLQQLNQRYTAICIGVDPGDTAPAELASAIATEQSFDDLKGGLYASLLQPYLVEEESMYETMRPGLCLIMPSLVESYGLVAAEALGIGMPIVVSKWSGLGQRLMHLAEHPENWANATNGTNPAMNGWTIQQTSKEFKGLVEKIVLDVDIGGQFPLQQWERSVEWIREETQRKRMSQHVALLKAVLGSWVHSVQTQFCDVIAKGELFRNQERRIKHLADISLWIRT